MPDDAGGLPLAQVIRSLRQELISAIAEGADSPLRFRLKPVELELELGITGTTGANAGVKFWVFDLGGKAERATQNRHKIKLTLEPVDSAGNTDVLVSAHDERGRGGGPNAPVSTQDERGGGGG